MCINKLLYIIFPLLIGSSPIHAQNKQAGISIDSSVDSTSIPTIEASTAPESSKWTRQLHVKTNAIGLGLGIANLAVEADICQHLSFTLPVYYSAWDYFQTTGNTGHRWWLGSRLSHPFKQEQEMEDGILLR